MSSTALAHPPPRLGRLTLFFSAGDIAGAWRHMSEVVSSCDSLLHGDTGAALDTASLGGGNTPLPEEETSIALAQLLALKPGAVLMPRLTGELAGGDSRWERTQALLAAGIAVFAPLDVTELASAAPTSEALTGRRALATVSDAVLQRADQIIWVDRRRTPADSATPALRTLALRILAAVERSDKPAGTDALHRDPGATVLAVIGPDDGERIVQTAARLARQLELGWEVIYAQPPDPRYSSAAAREAVHRTLKLAASLGARTATIPCLNIADAVAQYTRAHRSQHLVTGIHPGRASERWPRRLVELVPDVELTLVPITPQPWPGRRFAELLGDTRNALLGTAATLSGCVIVTVLGLITHGSIENVNIALLYLLLVFIIGRSFGRAPAALSALIASWAFYFYFVPPFHGFGLSDFQYFLTFAVMLTVALITGNLTAGLRYQNREAVAREARTRALYELAQALSGVLTRQEVAAITERIMAGSFGIDCGLLCPDEEGQLQPLARSTAISYDRAHAQAVFDASDRRQLPPGEPVGATRYLPLRGPMRTRGVLILEPSQRQPGAQVGADLDACASVVAIALERIHYVEISQRALLRIESERLRNSLLTAISHDLRTPLTALVGLAESLRFAHGAARLQQGIDDICDEAARLSRLVDNLLDMARLQTGAVQLRQEWQSIEEIVGCALYSLRFALQRHRVETSIPADLPLLRCDATLIERVVANLLENAAKYVHEGGHILISAIAREHELRVSIEDDGPGIAPGTAIFDKFSRGDAESSIPGVGLGLAICRSIIEAHGGSVWQETGSRGGAVFYFSLPLAEPPPAVAEANEAAEPDEAAGSGRTTNSGKKQGTADEP